MKKRTVSDNGKDMDTFVFKVTPSRVISQVNNTLNFFFVLENVKGNDPVIDNIPFLIGNVSKMITNVPIEKGRKFFVNEFFF